MKTNTKMSHSQQKRGFRKLLRAFIFRNYSRQSHQDNSQTDNSPYKIDDKHIVHIGILADNHRLVNHKKTIAARPVIALIGSNLSNTAGRTTDANMTTNENPPLTKGRRGGVKLKIAFALFLFFLLFGNNAKAGLILGAPKYVGLTQGLVGYWSFNGFTPLEISFLTGPDMSGKEYDTLEI